jgi:hypothetical protein
VIQQTGLSDSAIIVARKLTLLLEQTIEREVIALRALTEEQAAAPRAPGKWSPKEELGHLIDSASNNHLRFVAGATQPEFRGAGYAQDEWVRLHGYTRMAWAQIVNFWFEYNRLLTALVDNIAEERLSTKCFLGSDPPVTLGFVIEDYVRHMQHHIDQLLRRDQIAQYPGATQGRST